MSGVDVDVVGISEWDKEEEVVCFARAGQDWQEALAGKPVVNNPPLKRAGL